MWAEYLMTTSPYPSRHIIGTDTSVVYLITMVINDIFEVLRIRKVIELLQYFLITLHTLLVTMINKQIYEI
jgi:hypothetical protein